VQSEIVVALISTLGTVLAGVWVALLSRGRVSNDYSRDLTSMSVYCGRVRGAAAAALKDCAQAVDQMQSGADYQGRNAGQRDRLFEDARFGEELGDELRPDLLWFNAEIREFRRKLRRVGEKIDDMSRSTSGGGETRRGGLADVQTSLRVLEGHLNEADAQFALLLGTYLAKQTIVPPRRVQRRFRRRARKRYDLNARNSERVMTRHLHEAVPGSPEPDDGAVPARQDPVQGDGARAAGPAVPPCGYCVWRCPHAPAALKADGGDRGPVAVPGG